MENLRALIERAVASRWDLAPRLLLHLNPADVNQLADLPLPAHVFIVPDAVQPSGTFVLRTASRVYA